MDADHPLEELALEAAALVRTSPPQWRHANKQAVFEIAARSAARFAGAIRYSRWAAMDLPERLDPDMQRTALDARPDRYDYRPVAGSHDAAEWHVNFADPHLFVAYSGRLFAQDEMQVAEHPALGALVEMLRSGGHTTLTVEAGQPTPILVEGVQRLCSVATEPNPSEGRPSGLYGNHFAAASRDAVVRATRRIDPPTLTNLIAMAARSCGTGAYSRSDIGYTLRTAYTGFRAAGLRSRAAGRSQTIVHTGFWGCGAFGGNRVLMALLQIIAARLAQINQLVFHAFSPDGLAALAHAERIERELVRGSIDVSELTARLHGLGLRWGVSDGN